MVMEVPVPVVTNMPASDVSCSRMNRCPVSASLAASRGLYNYVTLLTLGTVELAIDLACPARGEGFCEGEEVNDLLDEGEEDDLECRLSRMTVYMWPTTGNLVVGLDSCSICRWMRGSHCTFQGWLELQTMSVMMAATQYIGIRVILNAEPQPSSSPFPCPFSFRA